ncbi:MAG: hypothetical protein KDM81_04920 [Verrucomicrobiae bacterium]|nr:hypothetical protein [Verrucomicrobiae bacterium]
MLAGSLLLAGPGRGANIAPLGSAILGVNAAIDTTPGTPHVNAGVLANLNDGNLNTRADTWYADVVDGYSYVGVLWRSPRFDEIDQLTLRLATFSDGGWFGYSWVSPGPGETLTAFDVVEPTLQVTTDGGATWVTVGHSSDYLTVMDGHGIGGGANPNPTAATAVFTLTTPASQIDGIRIIGENGGAAGLDANGFLGVFELMVNAEPGPDTDVDGLPDAWETRYGLIVGVNDAGGDGDGDLLINRDEFAEGTNPGAPDTDGDGLQDGAEIADHGSDPLLADTDADGLEDGPEVNTYGTDPTDPDSDNDGLSDGDEVNVYASNPLSRDTDADTFVDGLEVAQGTDPSNPASYPSNASLTATGILGVNDAVDADAGTPRFHSGVAGALNDTDLNTRVDNWFGDGATDLGQKFSYVGMLWPAPLPTYVKSLTLTLATFTDGGWFGFSGSGPGVGGTLSQWVDLLEPTIQVSTDAGATWTTVAHTSDYLAALDGHGIGGGSNPNPTSVTSTFTLDTPVAGVTGVRIIGENGGLAGPDANGFIGVFELEVTAGLANDTDNDGMDDAWETAHHLVVGVNDAEDDGDKDGLSNIREFAANTDPEKPDTDGDGLTDGNEVIVHGTSPVLADTDGDLLSDGDEVEEYGTDPLLRDMDGYGLNDGEEVLTYGCDPTKVDTDGDEFPDGLEVAAGTDPTSRSSSPTNVALLGTGIIGTRVQVDTGDVTPWANSGGVANINDADLTTRVDTYNGAGTDTASYVGILWEQPLTRKVARLELSLAIFFDGGWFGVNGVGPGSGGALAAANHLIAPTLEATSDGGATWFSVACTTDYLAALDSHPLPAVDFGAPTTATAGFELNEPLAGIDGIRLIGSEGGTASGGFLGVFELSVHAEPVSVAEPVGLLNAGISGGQFRFEFDSLAGSAHRVQFTGALSGGIWQTLETRTGDGTRQTVTDTAGEPARFYRVTTE